MLGILLTALALVSLKLIVGYDPTSIHTADSIFFSYYFLLFCAATVLCGLLIKTRSMYAEVIAQRIGSPVMSARLFWVSRIRQRTTAVLDNHTVVGTRLSLVLSSAATLLGFVFFFLPWTQQRMLAGYQFVIPQKPIPGMMSGGPLHLPMFYPVDPRVFQEIRYQVVVALLFLLMCVVHSILLIARKAKHLEKVVFRARLWAGYAVAFLAANYLFYMAILQYESQAPNSMALTKYLFSSNIVGGRGLPMMLYDPAYGFWGFVCCCAILLALSELHKRSEQC